MTNTCMEFTLVRPGVMPTDDLKSSFDTDEKVKLLNTVASNKFKGKSGKTRDMVHAKFQKLKW